MVRTKSGKPDLTGLWRITPRGNVGNLAADLKPGEVQPWADALYKQRMEDQGKDHMGVLCLPMGPGYTFGNGGLAKILQTPGLIAILYEDLTYRQIFLDGRALEPDPSRNWMGYSVGHREGEALVVESFGHTAGFMSVMAVGLLAIAILWAFMPETRAPASRA